MLKGWFLNLKNSSLLWCVVFGTALGLFKYTFKIFFQLAKMGCNSFKYYEKVFVIMYVCIALMILMLFKCVFN